MKSIVNLVLVCLFLITSSTRMKRKLLFTLKEILRDIKFTKDFDLTGVCTKKSGT